jgi:TonB family protein
MNPAIDDAILTVGSSLALSTVAKATFAMALGLGAAVLAGRKRAAVRHALLAGMFGVLLALPLVSAVAPPIRVVVRALQTRNLPNPIARPGRATTPVAIARPAFPAMSQSSRWSADLLVVCWIAGAVLFLAAVPAGLGQVRRLRRSGLPWQQGQSVVDGLAREAGISRRVDVLLHDALTGPMTCGTIHPAIVLPVDAPNWDPEDLHRAIVHELEHVIRRDWVIHCLARAVCAVYWFHPLVWTAWRRLELEAERSCDDAVLACSEATAYADQLVAIARRLSAATKPPLLAMASRADLASRVNAVLDGRQRRGRAGRLCVTVATAAAAALVIAVSPLRIVAAPQSISSDAARFRAETMLVLTPVKVSYPNGNSVEGLAAGDFTVTEDGAQQAISVFEFQKSGDSILGYYILGYYPPNRPADGQFRKIDIVVKTATSAKLDYRAGYYATKRPDSPPAAGPPARRPSPDTRPPVLIFKKEAEYTEEARKAKYQGTVLLDVEIDVTGKVADIQKERSLGLGLDEKAIDAVQHWRFRPATKDGKPVGAKTQVEVSFRLL